MWFCGLWLHIVSKKVLHVWFLCVIWTVVLLIVSQCCICCTWAWIVEYDGTISYLRVSFSSWLVSFLVLLDGYIVLFTLLVSDRNIDPNFVVLLVFAIDPSVRHVSFWEVTLLSSSNLKSFKFDIATILGKIIFNQGLYTGSNYNSLFYRNEFSLLFGMCPVDIIFHLPLLIPFKGIFV